MGRDFLPEEELPNAPDVALISDGLWRRKYGADPNIVGKKLNIRGNPTIVIGVLPAGFRFPDVKADIWELTTLRPEQATPGPVPGAHRPSASRASASRRRKPT